MFSNLAKREHFRLKVELLIRCCHARFPGDCCRRGGQPSSVLPTELLPVSPGGPYGSDKGETGVYDPAGAKAGTRGRRNRMRVKLTAKQPIKPSGLASSRKTLVSRY